MKILEKRIGSAAISPELLSDLIEQVGQVGSRTLIELLSDDGAQDTHSTFVGVVDDRVLHPDYIHLTIAPDFIEAYGKTLDEVSDKLSVLALAQHGVQVASPKAHSIRQSLAFALSSKTRAFPLPYHHVSPDLVEQLDVHFRADFAQPMLDLVASMCMDNIIMMLAMFFGCSHPKPVYGRITATMAMLQLKNQVDRVTAELNKLTLPTALIPVMVYGYGEVHGKVGNVFAWKSPEGWLFDFTLSEMFKTTGNMTGVFNVQVNSVTNLAIQNGYRILHLDSVDESTQLQPKTLAFVWNGGQNAALMANGENGLVRLI